MLAQIEEVVGQRDGLQQAADEAALRQVEMEKEKEQLMLELESATMEASLAADKAVRGSLVDP